MLHRTASLPLLLVAAMVAAGCQGTGQGGAASSAQQIVETVAAKHPEVVRLTLHAVPSGGTQMHAVGSTAPAKRGKPSDPEDARAMQTGEEVVLQEDADLDVTLPLSDAAGKRTAVAGVTLKGAGKTREQLLADARAIAAEMNAAIRVAQQPLW